MVKIKLRRRMVVCWKKNLVLKVMKYIRDIILKLRDYNIYKTNDYRVKIIESNRRYEVILNQQRCSCHLLEVSSISCVYAVAFICSMRDTNLENYISEYFTLVKYKTTYVLEIRPLPDKV